MRSRLVHRRIRTVVNPEDSGPGEGAATLLEKGLSYYQAFAADRDGTTASLYHAATAYRRVADIYRTMGRQGEAAAAIGRAIELLQIVVDPPESADYRSELADHYRLLGMFLCTPASSMSRSGRAKRQLIF